MLNYIINVYYHRIINVVGGDNDVDKPVARYFNAANYPISDIKVSAISPINDDDDSRKRHDKRLF